MPGPGLSVGDEGMNLYMYNIAIERELIVYFTSPRDDVVGRVADGSACPLTAGRALSREHNMQVLKHRQRVVCVSSLHQPGVLFKDYFAGRHSRDFHS